MCAQFTMPETSSEATLSDAGDIRPSCADDLADQKHVARLRHVYKDYAEATALTDINLDIRVGEWLAIIGRNGSGKSTLLELLKGLKKASRGDVRVLDVIPQDEIIRRKCSLSMDRPVYPYYATVSEVIELYARFSEGPVDAAALLSEFRLNGGKLIRHMSKGQLQRLSILLALVGNPQLVMLDEPTSGLDPQGRLMLWATLRRRLGKSETHTLLFSTHDLEEAERWADRVAILHEGTLVTVDTVANLFARVIGPRRKLTVVGLAVDMSCDSSFSGVESARFGSERAWYTDTPEVLLRRLDDGRHYKQVRIENVSLRDVYFRLTGEDLHDAAHMSA
jgi:ABC-2 type transport system ATP-binding protein